MEFDYAYGATPIDIDEAEGLIPSYIPMAVDFANLQLEYFHRSRRFKLGNIFILPALKSPAAMKISCLLNSQNKLPWVYTDATGVKCLGEKKYC